MEYDPDMHLEYADDAMSLETELEIIDPDTGKKESFVCDNLTSVIYFMVAHDLKPVREGIREGRVEINAPQVESFRQRNTLPYTLYIQVHGDPSLADKFYQEEPHG